MGKHFLLRFGPETIRIHFLMFGSYRIDNRREDKGPTLSLQFSNGEVNFYTCAAKLLDAPIEELYDWSNDVMSPDFDPKLAAQAAKLGKTLAEAGKGAKVTQSLHAIADRLIAVGEEGAPDVPAAGPGNKSLLGKIGGLKSMIGKKKA